MGDCGGRARKTRWRPSEAPPIASAWPSGGAWTVQAMPRRALALILEWAQEHRAELTEDWGAMRTQSATEQDSPCTL